SIGVQAAAEPAGVCVVRLLAAAQVERHAAPIAHRADRIVPAGDGADERRRARLPPAPRGEQTGPRHAPDPPCDHEAISKGPTWGSPLHGYAEAVRASP